MDRFRRLWSAAKPYRTPALVLLLLVAAAAWFGPGLLLGPQVPVRTVTQRDFVQSVVASGHVEAPHRVSIGTQITGTVRRVPVAEGQVVAAGQVLIELESAELRAAAAQADVAVAQAQARLRQVAEVQAPVAEQALRQAQVNLDNARAQLRRNADLFRQGFIGQAALDDLQKAVDLAQAQLHSAQKQVETARSGGSDHAIAVTALQQARASADAAHSRLRYATIEAPVAGTLIDRSVEAGDVVQPGKALMVLSPAGETELVVQIDEKNIHLLALGQQARASADAYPESRFDARLVYINPGVDAQRGSVEVKLAVAEPPAYLRQDMTVSVDIQVAARPAAVLVPTDAVHDVDAAAPWVLRVEEGRARRRPVRLGLRSGGLSEVLDGLRAGDLVVPAAEARIRDGSRLRPLAAGRAGGMSP
ncbi:efflux RND transporter periplasmic adaptor subunit [Caenimonas terrae]|uniref:Efflux RND transporter periplasmic adaptor subunit n=1 Tax=Caenimonas terrae TaxID=696074 RepID=A0ABW0NJ68_9BURK